MAFFPSFAPGTAQGITPPLNLQTTAGTNPLFGAGTVADTNNRVELDANGSIRFGTGAAAPDATLSRQAINVLQTSGKLVVNGIASVASNVDVFNAGSGLQVAEGANAKQGTATLAAGTVVVANTSVTATSRIVCGLVSLGTVTVPSALGVSARTAGTSFTILASQATDTSVVWYEMFEVG